MPRNIFEGLRLGSYRGKNSRWKPHGSSVFLLQCSGYLVDYDDMRGWKEKESGFKNNNKSNNKTQASYPLTGQTRSVSLGLWLCHIKSYFGTLQMYCDYLMDSGLWQSLIGTLTFPSFKEVTQNIQGSRFCYLGLTALPVAYKAHRRKQNTPSSVPSKCVSSASTTPVLEQRHWWNNTRSWKE